MTSFNDNLAEKNKKLNEALRIASGKIKPEYITVEVKIPLHVWERDNLTCGEIKEVVKKYILEKDYKLYKEVSKYLKVDKD